jgi:pyruvate/2-oxoglutarate/acetoin dehydrogenase E1 component
MNYGDAVRLGIEQALSEDDQSLVIGQGLWSPWYVGDTMRNLEQRFGKSRIIDTPVSEQACTGAAIGAALSGHPTIVTHPRVDFALLAIDQMVNQAAKWSSMFGGNVPLPVVFRLIVNRGGEQGAQHSQSLYSWFAHIPGLRVVLPSTPQDAQDLMVAAVRSPDPVVYIDDRWLYGLEAELRPTPPGLTIETIGPVRRRSGNDVTLVGTSYGSRLADSAAHIAESEGIECDVIDLRVVNPLDLSVVWSSVERTGRLVVADLDWKSCGLSGEVIASCAENVSPTAWQARPIRVTLPDFPAPTSKTLEAAYYPSEADVVESVRLVMKDSSP